MKNTIILSLLALTLFIFYFGYSPVGQINGASIGVSHQKNIDNIKYSDNQDHLPKFYYQVIYKEKSRDDRWIFWVVVENNRSKGIRKISSGTGVLSHQGVGEKNKENEFFLTSASHYEFKNVGSDLVALNLIGQNCHKKTPGAIRGGLDVKTPIVFEETHESWGDLLMIQVDGQIVALERDDALWFDLSPISLKAGCKKNQFFGY